MGISSERKRFLFISRGSNICLFSVDHHLSARVRVGSAVISTSLCLLARTAAHCWGAGCRPEKQHSECVCVCVMRGEEEEWVCCLGLVAGFVSVSEEQFLAMVLSDSLHQTIVLESSFGVVVVVGGGSAKR